MPLSGDNAGEPFGWNRGSVRALALVLLLLTLIVITLIVVGFALWFGSQQFREQAFLLVVGAVIALATTALNSYFGNRTPPPGAE